MPFQKKWQVLVFPTWMFSLSRDYSASRAVYSGLAVIRDTCYWSLLFSLASLNFPQEPFTGKKVKEKLTFLSHVGSIQLWLKRPCDFSYWTSHFFEFLSKLTPKKPSQELIQITKHEFIHKSAQGISGERSYITDCICPAAWQWYCIHSIWRQHETRVNATEESRGALPNEMSVGSQPLQVFLLAKDADFHPSPLPVAKAAELLPQHSTFS